jgi:hypothetical protein
MKRQNVKECAPRNRIELTEGILLCCTNAIETSAWFMINSTALGPVTHKYKRDLLNSFKFLNSIKKIKSKFIEIDREKHIITNQVCHIREHMLLHSCYKPANTKFESSH